jgi:hypothetical protein
MSFDEARSYARDILPSLAHDRCFADLPGSLDAVYESTLIRLVRYAGRMLVAFVEIADGRDRVSETNDACIKVSPVPTLDSRVGCLGTCHRGD